YHRPTVPAGAVHPRRRPLQLGRSEARRSNLNQDIADPRFRPRALFNTHAFRSLVLLPSEKCSHLGRERRRHVFTPWTIGHGPSWRASDGDSRESRAEGADRVLVDLELPSERFCHWTSRSSSS